MLSASGYTPIWRNKALYLNLERSDGAYFIPETELDETIIDRESFSDDLDRLSALRDRNWNAFREEAAEDLFLGDGAEIDGIYRDAIEAYFRVISREPSDAAD
ncbi:MAG: hypothetical protein AAF585_06605 [Verrucomicrobiota bacterium]